MQPQLKFSSSEKNLHEQKFQEELLKLNPTQKKAIEKIEGPVLVIAGPGTGKTQIIAARIGHILKSDTQTAPHNILCLTYTDAGTIAMRNRLLQFIGPTAYRVNIYTFHAFCNDIIQHNLDYFGKRELENISELENVQLLRALIDSLPNTNPIKRLKGEIYFEVDRMKDLFRKMKEEDWSPEFVCNKIDEYLNDLPNREEYIYKRANAKQGIKVGDVKQKDIDKQKERMDTLREAALLFPKYQEMMLSRNRYDYSDMILWVLNAFKKDENLLRNYQEWYQYFLVDEFQDTNGAQNEILQLLIDFWDKPNVFVVGDDDQSIYEFQGARVKNIMDFYEKHREEMEIIVLKENYRSSQNILDASKALIDNNVGRLINKIPNLDKTLIAKKEEVADSQIKPKIIQYYNVKHEEADIAEQIEQLHKNNFPLNEVAIIYYKHKQAENIIELMERKNIPYNVVKKINILDLPIVQQVLNIFRYLQLEHRFPNSGKHLLFEIMHYHFFKISPKDVAKISAHLGRMRYNEKKSWREFFSNPMELQQLNLENLKAFSSFEKNINLWIAEVSNLTLQMLFEKILNQSGLLKHILDSSEKIWLMQVITTLFDFVKEECAKRPRISIEQFLEMIDQMIETKISLSVNKTVFQEDGVNFITCHSAKGLEFKYVFLLGCTKDIWESSRGNSNHFTLPDTLTNPVERIDNPFYSEEENKIENARRLFYVTMTRAKEHLQISFAAQNKEGKEIERTRFIEEILEKTDLQIETKHLSNEQMAEYTTHLLSEPAKQKIDLLDKNFINSLLENYVLSVTHLNKYLDCPIAFYYENILKVPSAKNESMAFGSAVHAALKKFFDKMKANNSNFPSKAELLNEFRFAMNENRDSLTDNQFERRMALGEKALPEYYDKYIRSWNRVVLTEFNIKDIELEGVPLKGFLDKIEFTGNDVNVVDYKTGKVENGLEKLIPPNEKNSNGGDYWRQIVFYKILMDNYKRKNWKMISGEIDFVEKDEKKEKDFVKQKVIVTKADIATVKNQIKEVYQKIMNHEFSEGCGEEDCQWCEFVKRELN